MLVSQAKPKVPQPHPPRLTLSPHLTLPCPSLPRLTHLTSPLLISSRPTSPYLTHLTHLTSPHPASPHLASPPRLTTSPHHLASPPHLTTSPHLTPPPQGPCAPPTTVAPPSRSPRLTSHLSTGTLEAGRRVGCHLTSSPPHLVTPSITPSPSSPHHLISPPGAGQVPPAVPRPPPAQGTSTSPTSPHLITSPHPTLP